jgi:hypothetical protein
MKYEYDQSKALVTKDSLDSSSDELSDAQRELIAIGMNKSWRMPTFKAKHFVGHANITPYGAMKQYFLELNSREEMLVQQEYELEKNQLKIDKAEHDLANTSDEFVTREIQIELKKAKRTQTGMLRKLRNAREERLMYVHLIEDLDKSEHGVLPDGTRLVEAIYDPVKSEQLEQDYWVKRLGKQAAMDMIAYGRIGVGNMDSITMMDKNTQRETLQTASDIAITSEHRMNYIRDESNNRLQNGIDKLPVMQYLGLTKD